jgi:pimeloyl-ACP methyl ester carboxylesterase
MMEGFIKYKEYKMYYQSFGNGNKTLFAFQGFGRDSNDFKILEPSLGGAYKIIAFDLFYHGTSDSPPNPEGSNFMKEDFKEMINQYLTENNIERFSLLGYSLGGRISLQLIELYEDRIDTLFLFAPDGLHYTLWYNFVTKTNLGKNHFKRFKKNPGSFFLAIKLLNKIGIIKDSVYKFIIMQLDTQVKREKVFDTHIFFWNIRPDLDNVKQILNSKNSKLHLFLGRYDSIIPLRYGREFMKGINDKNALHILESGHQMIKDSVNEELRKIQ